MEVKQPLYPKLPTAPPPDIIEANNYRIQKILDIQNSFEKNKEERRKTLKKYTKVLSAFNTTDTVLTAAAIGTGVAGVGLLTTIVAAPIVLGMEIAALGMGAGSIIIKFINKKLQQKADKHRQILILSEAKLNTIHNHISKALDDGRISEEEFKLILEEETKFREMKEVIKHHERINTAKNLENHANEKEELVKKIKNFLEEK